MCLISLRVCGVISIFLTVAGGENSHLYTALICPSKALFGKNRNNMIATDYIIIVESGLVKLFLLRWKSIAH